MTAPDTAAVGKPITATKYNQLVTRLSAATTYVPTISNWASATTGPTTTGRYWRTGDIIHVMVQSKLGTGAITVGNITISLPVAMDTTGMIVESFIVNGVVSFNDVSAVQEFIGFPRMVDANTVRLLRPPLAGTGVYPVTSATTPFTWATLDEISLAMSYPIP